MIFLCVPLLSLQPAHAFAVFTAFSLNCFSVMVSSFSCIAATLSYTFLRRVRYLFVCFMVASYNFNNQSGESGTGRAGDLRCRKLHQKGAELRLDRCGRTDLFLQQGGGSAAMPLQPADRNRPIVIFIYAAIAAFMH